MAFRLKQLLRGEGDENRRGAGGQFPMDFNGVLAQGQAGHHATLLLEVQRHQGTVVLLGDALGLQQNVVQLPFGVGGVQYQEGELKHALIPALQFLEQRLGRGAVGRQIAGNNVHVISRPDSLFLFLDLAFIQIGDAALDGLDGLGLIQALDVHGHYQAAFHVQELGQHPILQFRGQDLQEGHRRVFLSHAEHPGILELEGGRGNEILGGQAGRGQPFPIEAKRFLGIHVKHGVHQGQPFPAVQGSRLRAQPLEIVENIQLNPLQPQLCRPVIVRVHAKGDILGLGQAVVALGQLVLQHGGVFFPDGVKFIAFQGNEHTLLKALHANRQIEEGELDADAWIEIIEEITPALEDGGLVLILRQLVIDVLKLDGFGVVGIVRQANAVRPHPLIGNRFLGGVRAAALLPGLLHQGGKLFLFLPRQLHFLFRFLICPGQSSAPPCPASPAGSGQYRSCWFCRGAASDA